jgi:hypothetical protein
MHDLPQKFPAKVSWTDRRLVGLAIITLMLLFAVLARLMNYELRRDEMLYASPAKLLDTYRLYKDFFYNHPPTSAWLFYSVITLLGTEQLLFAARLAVFLGWVILSVGVFLITFSLTRSVAMTVFALVVVLANDLLLGPTGMAATNNFFPLVFGYLGLGLFAIAVGRERMEPLLIFCVGLCLALAATVKISAVGFIVPVAVASVLVPAKLDLATRLRQVVLPLALGGILGAVPVLYYLATDPARFLAHVLGFHTGPHIAYWKAHTSDGEEVALTAASKAKLAYDTWFAGTNLIAIFVAILMLLQLAQGQTLRDWLSRLTCGALLTVTAALAVAAALSFVPNPSFPGYFAPPIVCLPLLLALLFARLDPSGRNRVGPALIAASILALAINAPRLLQNLPRLPFPARWTVVRVHHDGEAIAHRLAAEGVTGKVATLAPIYPLEADLTVYPELATGPFAYRTAQYTAPELATYFRSTSPATIKDLFAADPPAGILTGFDQVLEAPMVHFAKERGYKMISDLGLKDRYGEAVLYIRPSEPTP